VFTSGAGATFDLATTLPSGVARGGMFAVDKGGAALPSGVSLSPAGILSVNTAMQTQISGVVFAYTEPAS
jgi:hypothetical protein